MRHSEKIFDYIKPNENTALSDFNQLDLEELIYHLNKYQLKLRDTLEIDENITFGTEIECQKVSSRKKLADALYPELGENYFDWEERYDLLRHLMFDVKGQVSSHYWDIVPDETVKTGVELNSPILWDSKKNWQDLKSVCEKVSKYGKIDNCCGGHVHIGKQILKNEKLSLLQLSHLWSVYENIIYRFCYGEYLTERNNINVYARPFYQSFLAYYDKFPDSSIDSLLDRIYFISGSKERAFFLEKSQDHEFKNKNTIEFRNPNGTLNPVIWQNNIDFFAHLLMYADSPFFQKDILEKRRENLAHSSLREYRQIELGQALELADMIFPNNLKKVYFLRQYTKSFEVGTKHLQKAKRFTR